MIKKYHKMYTIPLVDADGYELHDERSATLSDECFDPHCTQGHIHMINEAEMKNFIHKDALLAPFINKPGVDVVEVSLWPHQELRVRVNNP